MTNVVSYQDNSPAAVAAKHAELARVGAEAESRAAEVASRAVVQPSAAHLSRIHALQVRTDANGRRPYVDNQQYREGVEKLRALAYQGDTATVQRELDVIEARLAGRPDPVPAQAQPDPNAAPPQGSPGERLVAGQVLGLAELPASATSGYQLAHVLPDGWGLSADDLLDLAAARRAGVSQAQVEAVVRERICAFRPMTDTIPIRWRTPFRRHGGQCSDRMADTLRAGSERCPP